MTDGPFRTGGSPATHEQTVYEDRVGGVKTGDLWALARTPERAAQMVEMLNVAWKVMVNPTPVSKLRDQVKLAIAREYGYESWAEVTEADDHEAVAITGATDAALAVVAPELAARDAREASLRNEVEFHGRRWLQVERVLDQAIGTEVEDGAGEGLASDVALLATQRDEARTELQRERDRHANAKADLLTEVEALLGDKADLSNDQWANQVLTRVHGRWQHLRSTTATGQAAECKTTADPFESGAEIESQRSEAGGEPS